MCYTKEVLKDIRIRLAHTAFDREDLKTALEYFELELRTAI